MNVIEILTKDNAADHDIDPARRVKVHWNIHRGRYSVLQAGRVRVYAREVSLTDARMLVQQAGWRKAIETGVRNVHAFVSGCLDGSPGLRKRVTSVRYSVKAGEFVTYCPVRGVSVVDQHQPFITLTSLKDRPHILI
tara:strand:- start:900 stop:1310 length:411 start_codon:yes stop_codon:yes gene_type:complete